MKKKKKISCQYYDNEAPQTGFFNMIEQHYKISEKSNELSKRYFPQNRKLILIF